MKTIVISTLAIVTLTILASTSAQAQTRYHGNSYHGNSAGYLGQPSGVILPAPSVSYGRGYTTGAYRNGRCNPTGLYGAYQGRAGYGFGPTLASWFAQRPATYSVCPGGRCGTYPAVTPYGPSTLGTPSQFSPIDSRFNGNGPYYGSY